MGVTGYMAYGDNTAGDILMSFKTPTWLVDMATIMVGKLGLSALWPAQLILVL